MGIYSDNTMDTFFFLNWAVGTWKISAQNTPLYAFRYGYNENNNNNNT